MNPPPNREVALFGTALELESGLRAAFLDEACGNNSALRLHIEALLRVHDEAIGFLETSSVGKHKPLVETDVRAREEGRFHERAGDRVGRYKLLQQIGEGGCGLVYMAEQEEPVRRRVALKVIKLGMDTNQVMARFEAERQALALMDHPNIAKVLDAGATDMGRPFFVMELVRGVKITDYCDQNQLSIQERLKLFVQVCQAIQHAHQKGIIHRDIKPSNILVTVSEPGGPGCPKVIDFGIAKATTDQRLTDRTVFTAFEQFIGTPAYMSPEQATLTSLDVDTRSDIYSLGVLLYELLTGKTPLDQKKLLETGLEEMRRTIREQEPARPSTRLSTMMQGELTTTAKARQTEPPKLIHLLRGDLDWIVMKALEKDRSRRYETANGLAMDVQRYLANEPIVARPPSNLYRFEKFARRNKLAFGATGAVAAALIVGLAVASWEYFNERSDRQRAVAAEQQAQAINRFLTEDLLYQATPEKNTWEKKVTMEEVLHVATSNLDQNGAIAQQPQLEATLRLDIGTTYLVMGALTEAERNLRRAFELRRKALGPHNLDTLAAEAKLAEFLVDYVREYDEAEALFRDAWQGRQRLLGSENPNTLEALEGIEDVLYETGRYEEAERLARQILSIRERQEGRDAVGTIDAIKNVAATRGAQGDYQQSERLLREALSRWERNKTDQILRFILVKELAMTRLMQADPQTADQLLTEAIPQVVERFGPSHQLTLHLQRVLARAMADEGQFAKAEMLAKKTLEVRRHQASDPPGTGRTLLVLGRVLVEQQKLEEAEPLLKEALTILREHVPKRDALVSQTANWLGAIQVSRQAYPEAETLLLSGSEQFFTPDAQMSPNERRVAVTHILSLYQKWGKPEQTATWQRKLDQLGTAGTKEPGPAGLRL